MSPSSNAGILYHPQLGECSYSLQAVSDDPDTQVSQVIGMMNDYVVGDSGRDVIAADCSACRQTGDPILDTWAYLSRYGGSRGMQFQRDEITAAPIENSLPMWQPVVEALIRPADLAIMPVPSAIVTTSHRTGPLTLSALACRAPSSLSRQTPLTQRSFHMCTWWPTHK